MAKRPNKKPRGITNKQASFLAALQLAVGEKFTGRGMTMVQADAEIKRLVPLRKARRRQKSTPEIETNRQEIHA
ncbi:MAG TPA: hypothetical protein VIJ66_03535 [Solirubrobacteraceae bacterium]